MKTTIEVGGFEIKIEEMEGNISVSAMKEGEVVEEFELASEDFDAQDQDMDMEDDNMMSFGDEDMDEEGDFEDDDDDSEEFGEEEEEEEEFGQEEEEEEEEESEGKLESFSYFVKKRKK